MPPHQYFLETPSLEGLPTKAKEDPSPHEMRLSRWTSTQYFLVSGKYWAIIIIIIIIIIVIIYHLFLVHVTYICKSILLTKKLMKHNHYNTYTNYNIYTN